MLRIIPLGEGTDGDAIHWDGTSEITRVTTIITNPSGEEWAIVEIPPSNEKGRIQLNDIASIVTMDTIEDGTLFRKVPIDEYNKLLTVAEYADVTGVLNVETAHAGIDVSAHSDLVSAGADIDSAVSLKHIQGTDTTLGIMTASVDMGNYDISNINNLQIGSVTPSLTITSEASAFNIFLQNAPHAQASSYKIPDSGVIDSNIVVTKSTDVITLTSIGGNSNLTVPTTGTLIENTDSLLVGSITAHSDITSSGVDIESAVTLKHTQGTDTTIGPMTANIDLAENIIFGINQLQLGTSLQSYFTISHNPLGQEIILKNADHAQATTYIIPDSGVTNSTLVITGNNDSVKLTTSGGAADLVIPPSGTLINSTDTLLIGPVSAHSDITSTGVNIEDAVTKRHTQGTDTTLGIMTDHINMGGNFIYAAASIKFGTPTLSYFVIEHNPNGSSIRLQNASHGQSTTYLIPDSGISDSKIVVTKSADAVFLTSESGVSNLTVPSTGILKNKTYIDTTAKEGLVRIISNGDTSEPTYSLTAGNPQQITYTSPLLASENYFPQTSPTQDVTSIYKDVGSYIGVFQENPVLGQMQKWCVTFSYSGKTLSSNVGLYFTVENPVTTELRQVLVTLPDGETSNNNIVFTLTTSATTDSLESPLGTGAGGYKFWLEHNVAAETISVTINCVARLNS